MLFQPLQMEFANIFGQQRRFFGFIPLFPQTAENVFLYRHVGEQSVVLEQKSHLPLLGRKVDFPLGVINGHAVQNDFTGIRGFDARDAPEGHTFAAAGAAQQRQNAALLGKGHIQTEAAEVFLDVYCNGHRLTTDSVSGSCRQISN